MPTSILIVLGKMKQAVDLLEKRGGIYSSRPRNIMACVVSQLLIKDGVSLFITEEKYFLEA